MTGWVESNVLENDFETKVFTEQVARRVLHPRDGMAHDGAARVPVPRALVPRTGTW